ncbi:MAG: dTMP kinase [Gammaproteobacteria bacterium]|nr:dTMP kinase [Gammaproteobacteria bacterium]MCW8988904.1 dTMP kinase [Gammaproteobacteria bacterium]MCW9031729.1 dTMP kinase [Gammaproteobacteria bacterium]
MNDSVTKGQFITIEGTEGVGKSTNMAFIEKWLINAGKELIITREPGGTELGEKLRAVLLDAKEQSMSDDTELLLMFAARAQHIHEVIQPALDAGKWVLCDRFTDATYAYQGGGRGIELSRIAQLEQWVQGDLRPNMTLILDLPVDVGLMRAGKRSTPDRFELEKHDFFNKVRDTYLARAAEYPNRYRVIDASPSISEVQQSIQRVLEKMV